MKHTVTARLLAALLACALLGAAATAQDLHEVADNPFPKEAHPPAEMLYDFDAGFLGVHHETDRFLMFDTGKGVRVINVARGSPARRGGLSRDDIITHFQGRRVTKSEELDRMVREAGAGQIVVVDLIRGAKRYQTVVQLDYRPDFDRLYRRKSIQWPHPVPFIFDYEENKAFDYKRISFIWPVIRYEKNGRKERFTLVTWPLTIEFEDRKRR